MGIFGDLVTDAMGGFGSKPKVPVWADITLDQEQQKAIAANLAALPGAENLVSQSNAFTQDQITKMLEGSIPGYHQIVGNIGSNISDLTAGRIPTDVQQMVETASAGRALEGGYGGSGMSRNLVARDLGLTSLNLTQQGLNSAESWLQTMNSIFAPGMMNLQSMFVSPQQMFNDTFMNQEAQWGVQWLRNQLKAMPDPATAAIARDVGGMTDSLTSIILPIYGMLGQSGGSGGGGMMGMGGGSSGGGGGMMNMLSGMMGGGGGGAAAGGGGGSMMSMIGAFL